MHFRGAHRDDGVLDALAQEGLGGLLHALQDHGADLLGGEHLRAKVGRVGMGWGGLEAVVGRGSRCGLSP